MRLILRNYGEWKVRRPLLTLALLLLLCGCLGKVVEGPSLDKTAYRFSEAMRWGDFVGAGNFIQTPFRDEFFLRFPRDDENIKVVGSRVESVRVGGDQQSAEVDYLLEYYKLPSSRVKKWRWTQHWKHQPGKLTEAGIWEIVNAPPGFP